MVFLKLVNTEYQENHKTQPFWVKVVHLVPNVQTLAGHDICAICLAPTTTPNKNDGDKTAQRWCRGSKNSKYQKPCLG